MIINDQSISFLTKLLSTTFDNGIATKSRKNSGSYWSDISKSRQLFRSHPIIKGWYNDLDVFNDAESLWKLHKSVTTLKVFDPTVGGCALLIAAHIELLILDDLIQKKLSSLGEAVDGLMHVVPSNFYGIEKFDNQYNEATKISSRIESCFCRAFDSSFAYE